MANLKGLKRGNGSKWARQLLLMLMDFTTASLISGGDNNPYQAKKKLSCSIVSSWAGRGKWCCTKSLIITQKPKTRGVRHNDKPIAIDEVIFENIDIAIDIIFFENININIYKVICDNIDIIILVKSFFLKIPTIEPMFDIHICIYDIYVHIK